MPYSTASPTVYLILSDVPLRDKRKFAIKANIPSQIGDPDVVIAPLCCLYTRHVATPI